MSRVLLVLAVMVSGCDSENRGEEDADLAPDSDGPTYLGDIRPLAQAKCTPCHDTGGTAGVPFAQSYEPTRQAAGGCPGLLVYECMPVLVRNGTMPLNAGCNGDPALDEGNPACLTATELDLLEAWSAAGGPE